MNQPIKIDIEALRERLGELELLIIMAQSENKELRQQLEANKQAQKEE